MEKLKKIIDDMRKRIKYLREDTLVSINEGVTNDIVADELEQWVTKIEACL